MKKYTYTHKVVCYLILVVFALLPLCLLITKRLSEQYEFSLKDCDFSVSLSNNFSQSVKFWHDEEQNKYYVFLPSYANEKNTTLSLPDNMYLDINGQRIEDGSRVNIIPFEKNLTIALYNEKAEIIEESHLEILATKNLSAMLIQTQSGDINRANNDKSHKEPGNVAVVSPDGGVEYNGELEYIKSRGNFTYSLPKKSYVIKTPTDANFLNLGLGKKWVLFANYFDKSHIRNKIAYDTAEKAGLSFSPDCDFLDLYIDGEYVGLYLLSESVEVGANCVDIQDLSLTTQSLNPALLKDYFPFTYNNTMPGEIRGMDIPANPPDITGGYLLELELPIRYINETSGFITSRGQSVVIQSPKYASQNQVEYISGYINEFSDALYSPDGINPDTEKGYWEYIDVSSWAKKFLLDEIFKNMDSGQTSAYFYKFSDTVDSKIYAGPVWDYDLSTGNASENARVFIKRSRESVGFRALRKYSENNLKAKLWNHVLCAHQGFYQELLKEYNETFLPIIDKLINNEIDELAYLISYSNKLDKIRWNSMNQNKEYIDFDTDKEHYEHIKSFLKQRMEFLRDAWLNNGEYYTVSIHVSFSTDIYPVVVKSGEKISKMPPYQKGEVISNLPGNDGVECTFINWYYKDTEMVFDPEEPITSDISIYGDFLIPEIPENATLISVLKSNMHIIYILIMGVMVACLFYHIRRLHK